MKTGKFETLADAVRFSVNQMSHVLEDTDVSKPVVFEKIDLGGAKIKKIVRI